MTTTIQELKHQRNKIWSKIRKTKKEISKYKPLADFDSRYSKSGSLSDTCCKLDSAKQELLKLKKDE